MIDACMAYTCVSVIVSDRSNCALCIVCSVETHANTMKRQKSESAE